MTLFGRSSSFQSSHLALLTTAPGWDKGSKPVLGSLATEIHHVLYTHNPVSVLQDEKPREREEINTQEQDRAEPVHVQGRAPEGHNAKELNIQEQQEAGEDEEQRAEQMEEERKKELEEEEMEQAGQPERLEEEQDQAPEEHEWKKQEQKEEETNMLGDHLQSEVESSFLMD